MTDIGHPLPLSLVQQKKEILDFLNRYNEIPTKELEVDSTTQYNFYYTNPVYNLIKYNDLTEESKYCIKHYKTKMLRILPKTIINTIREKIFNEDRTGATYYNTFFDIAHDYCRRFITPEEHNKIIKLYVMKITDERILGRILSEIEKYQKKITEEANMTLPKTQRAFGKKRRSKRKSRGNRRRSKGSRRRILKIHY